jgi:hypothetical protein
VKARANRIGLGLQAHLNSLWQSNEGGVKDMDDPAAVQQWMEQQSQAYAERMGVEQIDPIIASKAYLPRANQAQAQLLNSHMSYRAKKRVTEYGDEMSANVGLLLNGAGNSDSDPIAFINRLGKRESSGDYSRVNTLGYTGLLQWGEDRLADFNRAHGTNYTLAQFRADNDLQDKANLWHIRDIDKQIDENGYLNKGWSRDGLRAVAHLGGKGGMHDFVMSGGKSNPGDAYGTKLSDYYSQFASPAAGLQNQLDEAIAFGIDPKAANKKVVDGVIAEAVRAGNPALLSVLDELDTGNGPLGNVAWVKDLKTRAAEKIEDDAWQDEQREYTIEQRERKVQREQLTVEGFKAIMADPFADHSALTQQALEMGHPQLAMTLHNTQQQLQNEAYKVPTNHEVVARIRHDIFRGERPAAELAEEVAAGAGVLYPQSTMNSLMDDIEKNNSGDNDWVRDTDVQRHMNDVAAIVNDRMTVKNVLGEVTQSGKLAAYEVEQEMVDDLLIWLEDNPEPSKARVRKFMRDLAKEKLSAPEWQKQEEQAPTSGGGDNSEVQLDSAADDTAGEDPFAGFTEQEIILAAERRGMPVDQFKALTYKEAGYEPPSWWQFWE